MNETKTRHPQKRYVLSFGNRAFDEFAVRQIELRIKIYFELIYRIF